MTIDAPDTIVATGGYCAPGYDLFQLPQRIIPAALTELAALWRSDLAVAPDYPPRPRWWARKARREWEHQIDVIDDLHRAARRVVVDAEARAATGTTAAELLADWEGWRGARDFPGFIGVIADAYVDRLPELRKAARGGGPMRMMDYIEPFTVPRGGIRYITPVAS